MFNFLKKEKKDVSTKHPSFELELTAAVLAYEIARSDGEISDDELSVLMGEKSEEINLSGNPNIILISGLQGSGKTTFSGKLANYLKKQNKKSLLVACDVYRPAAIEQLHVLGKQIDVEVFSDEKSKSPLNIAKKAIQHAKKSGIKSVIIDTAGRLAIDEK